ncbi:MAG: helix-turn-helix transcriptional regulator [Wenzhouxiangella sp.]|nr:helix-turn-helix transcriptional regulator [Wenzhouxiangella sp.]MCH8478401.1 AraC family transcriptional regulator [Wenzhouxiangella sp.]
MALIRVEVLLHLTDPDFSVDQLASRLGLSRSVLYRQVAELTESSPAELIREIRLDEAMTQLLETDHQVSCIAYATGFRSVSSFSRAFTKKMGMSPRQWRHQQAENKPDK